MYLGGGVGKAAVRFGGFKGHTGKTPRENNIFYIMIFICQFKNTPQNVEIQLTFIESNLYLLAKL